MSHSFHPTILREYDIRGIIGETLSVTDALHIGKSFGTMVRKGGGRTVCVGRDGRLSSPALAAAVIEGLVAVGCSVLDIGMGPTPMLYYAAKVLNADGGIQITGSHNPPNHNGFKLVMGNKPFFADQIRALGPLALSGQYADGAGGKATLHPIADDYTARLAQDWTGVRSLTVVWDCGNGAAGAIVPALIKLLPGRHVVLYPDVDGTFPNHHPDPTEPHNLVDLQNAVATEHADLGLAFDGDGDRIGVVDGRGRILWGDQILVVLAEDVLARLPGAKIIADVKASKVFFDEIARLGGQPLMGRTGHSLIKTMMAETGAPLAGEMSGHIFFADRYYGFDDALYAAVRLLSVVASWPAGQTLADRRDLLPQMFNTPELRFACAEDRKFDVVAEVKARLEAEGATVNGVDGVRVDTPDGWWLLRASNTQAVLVARCEATTEAGLDRLKALLQAQLTASGVALPK